MDGVAAPKSADAKPKIPDGRGAIERSKKLLILVGTLIYLVYVGWCVILMSVLPSPTGQLQSLVRAGLMTSIIGGALFAGIGVLLFLRIGRSKTATNKAKQSSMVKLLLIVTPGIVLSCVVPYTILRQPTLWIDTDPANQSDYVAPLAITFSAKNAADILKRLGKNPVQYAWDTDGDGKTNDTTIQPTTTALYKRTGSYGVTLKIKLSDGTIKAVTKRILIQSAVFSTDPEHAVVDKAVKFSVAHLLTEAKQLKQVQWDFDGDGKADEKVTVPEISHVFYGVGPVTVTAWVDMENETQKKLTRSVEIFEPTPLPFPVTVKTEPANLIGPPPLGVIFVVETQEPVKEITWTFGDGKEERGADLFRVGHSFTKPGVYSTLTKVRSSSGKIAEISSVVRVTELLEIEDLSFVSEPVVNNEMITGELPLSVNITPKTALPLIQFSWEYSSNADAVVTDSTFSAVYRREGDYVLTLIAEGPDGASLRLPLTIRVQPPAPEPTISIKPETGMAPLHVLFDASQTFIPEGKKIAGFRWTFGDEKTMEEEPELGGSRVEHTFVTAGEYNVKLAVVTSDGEEYEATRTIIVRKPALSACILPSRTSVEAGGAIRFDSSCSVGENVTYLWEVRATLDPTIPSAEGATAMYDHVFSQGGTYQVTLTLTDSKGNKDSKSVDITVNAPPSSSFSLFP